MAPPKKEDIQAVLDFDEALKKALPTTVKFRTEQAIINKAFETLKDKAGEGVQALDDLERMQVALNKTLGVDGTEATIKISEAFEDLNKKMLGLQETNIQGAFEGIRKSFALTNKEIFKQAGSTVKLKKAMDEASKSIAKNSNVIDQSKLVDFTNKFTFQTENAVNKSEKFGEKLVGLAYRLGLPNEQLLTLGQNMLSTGNYFGETNDKIEEATLKATEFGRALGTTGDVVNKQLESMQTISGRQQLAARLSQIGSMVGVDIDISKLMSADPDEQRQGLRDALRKFSSSSKNLTAAQKRALSLTLSKALPAFGREAIQTALVRGVDIEAAQAQIDAARKDAAEKGAITDRMRREAATTQDKRTQYLAARQREAGRAQLAVIKGAAKDFNVASNKFSGAVENFGKYMDGLQDKIVVASQSKDGATAAGKVIIKELGEIFENFNITFNDIKESIEKATPTSVPVKPSSK
jgi:hypothetical protein